MPQLQSAIESARAAGSPPDRIDEAERTLRRVLAAAAAERAAAERRRELEAAKEVLPHPKPLISHSLLL